ncbi:MAG TPA: phosphatase PAP2 family protein [Gemmatimonadaceae bacterium]|nr:phosphatase PAP2 family protein [Gemmatimonadaceae bacterium]
MTVARPRIVARPVAAAALVTALALVARELEFDRPTRLDRRVRRLARTRRGRELASVMSPLFPIGLPGGYITIASATAWWLHRRGRAGGPRIVAAAWAGWLAHRAFKLAYRRQRPRRGARIRTDSYPSGHTTGVTALALTTAAVLRRERMLSTREALVLAAAPSIVMGAYRVIADDHWTTDVIGGWLLGGAVAAACAPGPREPTAASRRASSRRSRPGPPTSAA